MDLFSTSLFFSVLFIAYGTFFAQMSIFFKRNGDPWWFGIMPIIGCVAAIGSSMMLHPFLALGAWFLLFLIFGVMPGWRFCEIIGISFWGSIALGFLGLLALPSFSMGILWWKCEDYPKALLFFSFLGIVFFRMNLVVWKFLSYLQAPMSFRLGLYASYYGLHLAAFFLSKQPEAILLMISLGLFALAFVYISWLMCFRPGQAPKRPEIPAEKKVLGPYLGAILSGMFFPPLALVASGLAFAGLRRPEPNEVDRKYLRAAMVIGLGVGIGFTSIYLLFSMVQKAKVTRSNEIMVVVELKEASQQFVARFAKHPNAPIPADFGDEDKTLVYSPDLAGRGLNQVSLKETVCGFERSGKLHYVLLDGSTRSQPLDGLDVADALHQINRKLKP